MQPLLNQSRSVLDRLLQRALPHGGHAPAKRPKRLHVSPVTVNIAQELPLPELFVGSRGSGIAAAFVPMPEAAMDEHHCSALREHKVGGAGQPPHMKSISKTPGEKEGAKYPFRPGVLSANARHHAAALRSGRNAHGLEHLPPECLQKWQLRASAWQCERMKTNTRSSNSELTMHVTHEKTQEEADGS